MRMYVRSGHRYFLTLCSPFTFPYSFKGILLSSSVHILIVNVKRHHLLLELIGDGKGS
jgi:hypothetical protein